MCQPGVKRRMRITPAANGPTQDAMDENQIGDYRCRAQCPITCNDSDVRQQSTIHGLFTTFGSAMHGVADDLDTRGPPQPFGRGSTQVYHPKANPHNAAEARAPNHVTKHAIRPSPHTHTTRHPTNKSPNVVPQAHEQTHLYLHVHNLIHSSANCQADETCKRGSIDTSSVGVMAHGRLHVINIKS